MISKGDVAWRALSTGCPCWGCQALPVTPRSIPPPGGGLSSAARGGGREEGRAESGSAVPPSPSLCSWPLTRMMWVLQCLSLGQGVPNQIQKPLGGQVRDPPAAHSHHAAITDRDTAPLVFPLIAATPRGCCNLNPALFP